MECDSAKNYLHAYLDGELDLNASLEFEEHLRECPECSRIYAENRAIQSAVRDSGLYHHAPAGLAERLTTLVGESERPQTSRIRPRSQPMRWVVAGALAATLLLVVASTWILYANSRHHAVELLADQLVTAHVRSLQVEHLTDVATSDTHTVKPWFSGKLDFSPPVKDLAEKGFPLIGGRLDYLDNRNVAALAYHCRRHIINLFIWPSTGSASPGAAKMESQGYHLLHWTASGMEFWAVSDVNEAELHSFEEAFRS